MNIPTTSLRAATTKSPSRPQRMPSGRARTARPSVGAHVIVIGAIACVSLALGVFLTVTAAIPIGLGVASGVAFASLAAAIHFRISRPIRSVVSRPNPAAYDRFAERAIDPLQPSGADKDADPMSFPGDVVSPRAIEPSDLAVALLASLSRGAPQSIEPGDTDPPASLSQPRQSLPTANPRSRSETETEFERVDRLVKRLADNVNQVQAMRDAQAADKLMERPHPLPAVVDDELPLEADNELVASINALKRANAVPAPTEPLETELVWPLDVRGQGFEPTLTQRAAILAALNAERIDVYLEPILDLGEQRPQHYEVSIALKTAGGHTIDLADAASDLSGTGLLPLIDQARIARAADMARRLADRGKVGAVFAGLSSETVGDPGFSDTFADSSLTVGAFPGQLVLTLAQAHVATFATADWRTLARLREAGFGFALSDVTALDMDFARLADVGFTFARLDAQTFLEGLPTSGGIVSSADICRHIAGCGLMLIVGGIVEDYQLARIFGFGVVFGQGRLFGGARPTKAEVASAPRAPDNRASMRLQ